MTDLVRPARPEDAARLGEVHVGAWQWAYEGLMPAELLSSLRPESRARAWVAWLTEDSTNNFRAWVAEVDGLVVGFASSSEARDDDVPDSCVELLSIYLLKPYLGRGLGHEMMVTAESCWREDGYGTAVLWVLESNTRTRHFYKQHGWETDGSVQDHPVGNGAIRPAVRYTKLLD